MSEENGDLAKKLVKVYVKIRDKRKELKTKFEEEDKALEDQLEAINAELLEMLKTMGAESMRTEFGTITKRVYKRYYTNDWYSFHNFVKEHDALDLLEKRVSQGNMTTFLEENPDLHPPGLNVDSRYAVVITKR
jgi:predicted nuclease with TOPRIM domain